MHFRLKKVGVVKFWGRGIAGLEILYLFINYKMLRLLGSEIIKCVIKPIVVNSNKLWNLMARLWDVADGQKIFP